MNKPSVTEQEFATLAKRTGLPLSAEQIATLYEAYGAVEAMAEKLRRPRDLAVEPALTFTAGDRGTAGDGSC